METKELLYRKTLWPQLFTLTSNIQGEIYKPDHHRVSTISKLIFKGVLLRPTKTS
jgi:hypothetical protein